MTVHTDITPADWTAFVRFVARSVFKSSGGRLGRWFIAFGVGTVLGATVYFTGLSLHMPSLLVGCLCSTLWVLAISRLQMSRMIPASDGYILGRRQVTLSDEGLRETSQRHEFVFRWHAVRGTQFTDGHLFVMVDNNAAIIIPRRAFSSDSEREQFVGEIQRRTSNVRTSTPA